MSIDTTCPCAPTMPDSPDPRDQAEVILLRVVGGLDVGEVAAIVGKRPGTVRVLQHRGLRRLAEEIARDALERRGVTG